jgi:hypothetical protein
MTSTGNVGCLKKQALQGIAKVTVWRVLPKRLHVRAYKLSIVQHLEPLSVNVFVTLGTQ